MCTIGSMFKMNFFSKGFSNLEGASRRANQWLWILLAVIILVGTGLRLVQWDERSLWQDEVFTLSLATGNPLFEATILPDNMEPDPETPQPPSYYRGKANAIQPWADFMTGIRHNIQMPLYPFLVRNMAQNFTDNPIHMRLLSILAGILAIPVAFLLGRELMDNRLGLLMAAIFALSGFQLIYSQTARVYALLTLVTLLTSWLAVVLVRQKWGSKRNAKKSEEKVWMAFSLLSVLGFYSHYFYGFVLVFHGLWLVAHSLYFKDRAFLKKTLLSGFIIALCAIPGLFLLAEQLQFIKTMGHGNLSGLWNPLSLIERLWNNLTSMISPKDTLTKIFASVIAMLGLVEAFQKKKFSKPLLFAGLWLLVLVGGIVCVDFISDTHRIMSKRYLILASPAIVLLFAYGLNTRPKKQALVGILLAFLLMAHNSYDVLSGAKFLKKENYRGAGLAVQADYTSGDLVLVSHSGVHVAGMAFYLPDDVVMSGISRRNAGTLWEVEELESYLTKVTRNHSQVWFVETHIKPRSLQQQVEGWMGQRYKQIDTQKFNGVRLLRYESKKR